VGIFYLGGLLIYTQLTGRNKKPRKYYTPPGCRIIAKVTFFTDILPLRNIKNSWNKSPEIVNYYFLYDISIPDNDCITSYPGYLI